MTARSTYPFVGIPGNVYCPGAVTHWTKTTAAGDISDSQCGFFVDLSVALNEADMREWLPPIRWAKKMLPICVYAPTADALDPPVVRIADHLFVASDSMVDLAHKRNKKAQIDVVGPYLSQLFFNPIGYHKKASNAVLVPYEGKHLSEYKSQLDSWKNRCSAPMRIEIISAEELGKLSEEQERRAHTPPLAVLLDRKLFEDPSQFYLAALKATFVGIPVGVWANREFEEAVGFDFVAALRSKRSVLRFLEFCRNPTQRERLSVKYRRAAILARSTATLIRRLQRELTTTVELREVSIICATKRAQFLTRIGEGFNRQSYPYRKLILLLHGEEFDGITDEQIIDQLRVRDCTILRESESTLFGDCLNSALDKVDTPYVTKFDDDDFYGEHHLSDLLVAHDYSSAEIVGKWAHEVYFDAEDFSIDWCLDRQEDYVDHLPGATILMRSELLKDLRFDSVPRAIDTHLFERLAKRNGRLYSTHRFNFTRVRHNDHTFHRDIEYFLKYSSNEIREGYAESSNRV
jgi:hypothetical protein